MERKFNFSIDEFYHIYNRGNNKFVIFNDKKDKKRFIKLLYICNGTQPVVFRDVKNLSLDKIKRGETLVDIGAYCLMPNHFHLLLHEKIEGGISKFMEKLSTSYSMYFNKKHNRTGKLFEGRFQAVHADSDEYLKYLFSYIHLNPVKIIDPTWKEEGIKDLPKTKKFLFEYPYSSYLDYLGVSREERVILDIDKYPKYFSNFTDFDYFIDEWLTYAKGIPWHNPQLGN